MAKFDHEAFVKEILEFFEKNKKTEYLDVVAQNIVLPGMIVKQLFRPGIGTEYELACPYCGHTTKHNGYQPANTVCKDCGKTYSLSNNLFNTGMVFFKYEDKTVLIAVNLCADIKRDGYKFDGFENPVIEKESVAVFFKNGTIYKYEKQYSYNSGETDEPIYSKTSKGLNRICRYGYSVRNIFLLDGLTEIAGVSLTGQPNIFFSNIEEKCADLRGTNKKAAKQAAKTINFDTPTLALDDIRKFMFTANSIDEIAETASAQVWCKCGHVWNDVFKKETIPNEYGTYYRIVCPNCGKEHMVNTSSAKYSSGGISSGQTIRIIDNADENSWDVIFQRYHINTEWDVTVEPNVAARVYKDSGKVERYLYDNYSKTWKKTQKQDKYNTYEHLFVPDSLKYSGLKEAWNNQRTGFYSCNEFMAIPRYLSQYIQSPVMEQVVKRNEKLSNILWKNCLEETTPVNYAAKNTSEFFGIPERLMKTFCKKECTISMVSLQELYKADPNISEESILWIANNSVAVPRIISLHNYGIPITEITNYLERVRKVQCVEPHAAVGEWADYLIACEAIGTDLNDKNVRYPRHLLSEHNIVINKRKFTQDEKKNEEFKECCDKYAKLFNYRDAKIIVKVPSGLQELFEEGRKLHHCVGSYADRIIAGESLICFIRKVNAPNTPWLTVDLNEKGEIMELKGDFDRLVPVADKKLLSGWVSKKNIIGGKWL